MKKRNIVLLVLLFFLLILFTCVGLALFSLSGQRNTNVSENTYFSLYPDSEFGSTEYVCHGTCFCETDSGDDQELRRNIGNTASKRVSTLLLAVSSILAYKYAKNQFDEYCLNLLKDDEFCENDNLVYSEVEECVDGSEIDMKENEYGEDVEEEKDQEVCSSLNDSIFGRRSIRDYDPNRKISKETLKKIVDVGNHAPSARNMQALRYHVCDDLEIMRDISNRCFGMIGKYFWKYAFLDRQTSGRQKNGIFYNAPVVIFITWKGGHDGYEHIDGGLAMQNMQLYAHSKGIGSCCIGWCRKCKEYIAEVMGFEKGEIYVCAMIFGYPNPERKVVAKKRKESWISWDKFSGDEE